MPRIQRKYRTILQRIAAGFIDGVIFLPVTMLFNSLADTRDTPRFVLWTLVYSCTWLAYSVFMHGKYGQTIGKKASNVKVYALDEKAVIGYRQAFLREIIWVIITLAGLVYTLIKGSRDPEETYDNYTWYPFLISGAIEILTTLFSSKRRSLYDLLAGSVVLDVTRYRKWDFGYDPQLDRADEGKA